YISRDFWRMEKNCAFLGAGNGSCVWSSDGVRYEFLSTLATSYYYGGTTLIWPLSAIVDPAGNRIAIANAADRSGSLNSITDTHGRVVSFTYNGVQGTGDGKRLDTMTVNNNVYQYVYTSYPTPQAGGNRRFLTRVTPPVGPSYDYAYSTSAPVSQNQYALSSITYPHRGSVSYSYSSVGFFPGVGPAVPFAVVSSKTVTN